MPKRKPNDGPDHDPLHHQPRGWTPEGAIDTVKAHGFVERTMPDGYVYRQPIFQGYPRKVTPFPPRLPLEEAERRRRATRARKVERRACGNRLKAILAKHGITTRPRATPMWFQDFYGIKDRFTPEQRAVRKARNIRKRLKRRRVKVWKPD